MSESNQNQKHGKTALAVAIIALAGGVLAVLLSCKHLFPETCSASLGCTTASGVDGCLELGKSSHSRLILGLPTAVLGLFYYIFMAVFYLMTALKALRIAEAGSKAERESGIEIRALLTAGFALAIFGSIFDLYLGYKNFFVLSVPCMLCMYTYLVQAGLLIGSGYLMLQSRKAKDTTQDLTPASKPLLIAASVAVLATALILMLLSGLFSTEGSSGSDSHDGKPRSIPLLAPEKAAGALKDLASLKKIKLSTRGLINMEGSPNAYITIHKFADFRCGHCYNASFILTEVLRRWPGRIKIYYRHFPLDGTCNPQMRQPQSGGYSCNGAQASLCATEQGIFSGVYHGIFNFQRPPGKNIDLQSLEILTEGLNGNWQKMVACMGSRRTATLLNRDLRDAKALDVKSTPTIILQGFLLPPGTPEREYFLQYIDAFVLQKEGARAYEEYKNRK